MDLTVCTVLRETDVFCTFISRVRPVTEVEPQGKATVKLIAFIPSNFG